MWVEWYVWPFSKKPKANEPPELNPEYMQRVLSAWAKRFEIVNPGTFYDVCTLPYPKTEIERCLVALMVISKDQQMRDTSAAALMGLADFQEDVGAELSLMPPLPNLDHLDEREQLAVVQAIAAHTTQNGAKLEKLKGLAAADEARYLALVASIRKNAR